MPEYGLPLTRIFPYKDKTVEKRCQRKPENSAAEVRFQ